MSIEVDAYQLEVKDLTYTTRGTLPDIVFDAKLRQGALFLDKDQTARISDGSLGFDAITPQTKELLDSLKGRRVQMIKVKEAPGQNKNLQGFMLLD